MRAELPALATGGTAPCYDVLGVPVAAMGLAEAAGMVTRWIRDYREGQSARYVCVADVHAILECRRDPALQEIYERAAMVTPDGMPLVWLGRLVGHRRVSRVYGPDLMLELCGGAEARGLRHFLYGGGPGVAELLIRRLRRRFPELTIAGSLSPPFRPLTEAERQEVVATIATARPDILWVGLGAPKQERWMAEMAPLLRVPIMIGVGAAFDFHAGVKPQAPCWMQRSGLEWLFRLASEPRRLWRRYLVSVGLFPWLALPQVVFKKSPCRPTISPRS